MSKIFANVDKLMRPLLKIAKKFYYPETDILEVSMLVVFKGKLYAVVNPIGDIWVYDGEEWEISYRSPYGVGHPRGHKMACFAFAEYRKKLYIGGTAYGMPQYTFVLEFDGEKWRESLKVERAEQEIFSMCVYGDNLYAGDEQGHIWRFDGTMWNDLGRRVDRNARSMAEFAGNLYVGTEYLGKAFEDAGSYNIIWVFDGTTWTKRTFGTERGALIWLGVWNGRLYSANGLHGELWASTDGVTWWKDYKFRMGYERPMQVVPVAGSLLVTCSKQFVEAVDRWILRGGSLWRQEGLTDYPVYEKLFDYGAELISITPFEGNLYIGTMHHRDFNRANILCVNLADLRRIEGTITTWFDTWDVNVNAGEVKTIIDVFQRGKVNRFNFYCSQVGGTVVATDGEIHVVVDGREWVINLSALYDRGLASVTGYFGSIYCTVFDDTGKRWNAVFDVETPFSKTCRIFFRNGNPTTGNLFRCQGLIEYQLYDY